MDPTSKSPKLIYSVPEARQLLGGIGHTLFYRLVRDGNLRLLKVGGRSFVTAEELERFVREAADASAA